MNEYLCKYKDIMILPKRIVAIIGDGKETTKLLKTLAGMCPGEGAKVRYGNEFGQRLKKEPWRLQLVPDDIVCYRDLTVVDFLRGITMQYGEVAEKQQLLSETFGINIEEKLLEMTFESNRAVVLTASLLASPVLLLLDKPFDMVSSGMYKRFIKEIVKTYFEGGTVVISAERYEDVGVLCSDYLFLKEGKVTHHFVGRKNLPPGAKVITIRGCSSVPEEINLQLLSQKENTRRYLYEGNDMEELVAILGKIRCQSFTVEELQMEERVYSDYTRWML